MYSGAAGSRTIGIYTSGGTLVDSRTVDMPTGESRVALNFNLTPGTGYFIKMIGTVNFFRHTAGAVYPYTLSGLVSITGNDYAAGYYYYFYDWNVTKAPCLSNRIPVVADVTICTNIADLGNTSVKIYPNPASNQLTVEGMTSGKIIISDVVGKVVLQKEIFSGTEIFNVSNLTNGIYYLQVTDGIRSEWNGKFVKAEN
jgi:hypothetical protein